MILDIVLVKQKKIVLETKKEKKNDREKKRCKVHLPLQEHVFILDEIEMDNKKK